MLQHCTGQRHLSPSGVGNKFKLKEVNSSRHVRFTPVCFDFETNWLDQQRLKTVLPFSRQFIIELHSFADSLPIASSGNKVQVEPTCAARGQLFSTEPFLIEMEIFALIPPPFHLDKLCCFFFFFAIQFYRCSFFNVSAHQQKQVDGVLFRQYQESIETKEKEKLLMNE